MSTPASSSPPASGHKDVPKWKVIGPGLVAAATGVGSGDLVATLIAGQKYGFALLWACIAGTIMKIVWSRASDATPWPPATPCSMVGHPSVNGPPGTSPLISSSGDLCTVPPP